GYRGRDHRSEARRARAGAGRIGNEGTQKDVGRVFRPASATGTELMLLISSPRFQEHTPPPGHPERPERAEVFDRVAADWRDRGGRVVEPRPATRVEILPVHDAAHAEAIEAVNS